MKKHPKAGMPVQILSGPYKGQYFLITDYLVNQFQGKSIDRIVKAQHHLVAPLVMRGVAVTDSTVFGQLYPVMTFMVLPEEELTVEKEDDGHDPELHAHGNEVDDDKPEASDTDSVVIPFAPKESNVTPITQGKKKTSKKVSKKGGKDDTDGAS